MHKQQYSVTFHKTVKLNNVCVRLETIDCGHGHMATDEKPFNSGSTDGFK